MWIFEKSKKMNRTCFLPVMRPVIYITYLLQMLYWLSIQDTSKENGASILQFLNKFINNKPVRELSILLLINSAKGVTE